MPRIAVVSDIHGNLTALEAVIADLRDTAPDLVLHGGDLAHGGAHPAEALDRIRDLGWEGVLGNVDEMLFDPASLDAFAARLPQLDAMWDAIREMAAWTRESMSAARIEWLRGLPLVLRRPTLAVVHASPESTWRCPRAESDYEALASPVVVYGHIHTPFVHRLGGMTLANSGSVGLPYDGDRRASYALLDDAGVTIRRVDYDVDREIEEVRHSGMPHAEWVAKMLATALPESLAG